MRREDEFKRKKACTSLDAKKNYSFLNCIMGININAYGRENQRVITINLCTEIELIIVSVISYHDVYFQRRTIFEIFYNYNKL